MTFHARPKHLLATVALLLSPLVIAQTPATSAAKPANATGQCKDGSFSTAASKSGACRGHKGVKDWYAAAAAAPGSPSAKSAPAPASAKSAPAPTAPAPPAARPSAPAPTQAAAPAQQATKPSASRGPRGNLANTSAAPGGGPGLVWVNTSSNVYHCSGTDFYGKTKAGSYMTEAAAKAKGARPDHGNACSK